MAPSRGPVHRIIPRLTMLQAGGTAPTLPGCPLWLLPATVTSTAATLDRETRSQPLPYGDICIANSLCGSSPTHLLGMEILMHENTAAA